MDKKQWSDALEKQLKDAVTLKPELAQLSETRLRQAFELVRLGSPTVAENALLLSDYLWYLCKSDGINYSAFSNLVSLENTLLNNALLRIELATKK